MGVNELLHVIANEDGEVDVLEAALRLGDGVTSLAEQGATLTADRALKIMQLHQDSVNDTLAEILVQLQAAVLQLQDGLSQLLTGQASSSPEFDVEAELEALTLGFEMFRLGLLYDALEESLEVAVEPPPE